MNLNIDTRSFCKTLSLFDFVNQLNQKPKKEKPKNKRQNVKKRCKPFLFASYFGHNRRQTHCLVYTGT